jgi:coproporphyrinogen III oxidase-like Fe-S oxidoreductase
MERARVKRNVHYDDETLEKMKRYYKIDDNEELLRFIKTHGLKNYNFDIDNS